MNRDEAKEIAEGHFKVNKDHGKYHVTSDGQCFPHWHDANEHSKTLGNRTIHEVIREDAKSVEQTAAAKVEQVKACATRDELTAIPIGNREHTSVRKALLDKMKEFDAADAKAKAEADAKAADEKLAAEKLAAEKKAAEGSKK